MICVLSVYTCVCLYVCMVAFSWVCGCVYVGMCVNICAWVCEAVSHVAQVSLELTVDRVKWLSV